MTKPIEGWVAWHPTLDSVRWEEAKDSLLGITVCMTPEACGEFRDAPDWVTRPVRIVFMDNTARDLIDDGFEDDTIATTMEMMRSAVMMDRERIWEWLDSNGILFLLKTYCPASMKYNEETEQNIKRAIFGGGEMTTDEDLDTAAATHANQICPEQGPEYIVWNMCKQDFIAGAEYMRKRKEEEHELDIKEILIKEEMNREEGL